MTAFDDTSEFVNGADPLRRARFSAEAVRSGALRRVTLADRDIDMSNALDSFSGGLWSGSFGQTGLSVVGAPNPVYLGTPEWADNNPTYFLGLTPRLTIPTTAVAGTLGAALVNANPLGANVTLGIGYSCKMRFARSDAAPVAGVRFFAGLKASLANPTNVQPDTLTNAIGVAQLSTDSSQLYLIASGSAAQAAVPLGAAMFSGGVGILYDLEIVALANATGDFKYTLTRVIDNVVVAMGNVSGTDVQRPAPGSMLGWHFWTCNNATALQARSDLAVVKYDTYRM